MAWHGSFNGKYVYFDTSALCDNRFYFFEPINNDYSQYERLAKVKYVKGSNLPLLDQVNENCQRFKRMFLELHYTPIDIIDISDPFLDEQLWITLDQNPYKKIIIDKVKFIKENDLNKREQSNYPM